MSPLEGETRAKKLTFLRKWTMIVHVKMRCRRHEPHLILILRGGIPRKNNLSQRARETQAGRHPWQEWAEPAFNFSTNSTTRVNEPRWRTLRPTLGRFPKPGQVNRGAKTEARSKSGPEPGPESGRSGHRVFVKIFCYELFVTGT